MRKLLVVLFCLIGCASREENTRQATRVVRDLYPQSQITTECEQSFLGASNCFFASNNIVYNMFCEGGKNCSTPRIVLRRGVNCGTQSNNH